MCFARNCQKARINLRKGDRFGDYSVISTSRATSQRREFSFFRNVIILIVRSLFKCLAFSMVDSIIEKLEKPG